MTYSILDNPVTVSDVNTPFASSVDQGIFNPFFNVFNMFWKYILALFILVCVLYKYTMRYSRTTIKKTSGG
jgi:flagellar biosynthesis/type III secretory pathway M-ring protein FliF/YscJ